MVLDSDGSDEYQECLLKAKIFEREDDSVFETFRLDADGHIPRKAYHIDRLSNAIGYDVKKEFETLLASLPKKDSRVKIEATHGRLSIKPCRLTKSKRLSVLRSHAIHWELRFNTGKQKQTYAIFMTANVHAFAHRQTLQKSFL